MRAAAAQAGMYVGAFESALCCIDAQCRAIRRRCHGAAHVATRLALLRSFVRFSIRFNFCLELSKDVVERSDQLEYRQGTALFAAFPLAFAIIMPALYFPILALLGLIFRGVAFGFRPTARTTRRRWDRAFFGGLKPSLAQFASPLSAF